VPLLISFAPRLDETAALAQFVCPDHHYLESWDDAEPVAGAFSVTQPAIRPIGQTRALAETLVAWTTGKPRPAYELMREHWQKSVFPRQTREASFEAFWDRSVHDGYVAVEPLMRVKAKPFNRAAVVPVLRFEAPPADAFALVAADPDLARPEHRLLREEVFERFRERMSLARVG
jgi:anaerobic selenocysteine-containing dehydrogenase